MCFVHIIVFFNSRQVTFQHFSTSVLGGAIEMMTYIYVRVCAAVCSNIVESFTRSQSVPAACLRPREDSWSTVSFGSRWINKVSSSVRSAMWYLPWALGRLGHGAPMGKALSNGRVMISTSRSVSTASHPKPEPSLSQQCSNAANMSRACIRVLDSLKNSWPAGAISKNLRWTFCTTCSSLLELCMNFSSSCSCTFSKGDVGQQGWETTAQAICIRYKNTKVQSMRGGSDLSLFTAEGEVAPSWCSIRFRSHMCLINTLIFQRRTIGMYVHISYIYLSLYVLRFHFWSTSFFRRLHPAPGT